MRSGIITVLLAAGAQFGFAQNLTPRQLFYKDDADAKPAAEAHKAAPKASPKAPAKVAKKAPARPAEPATQEAAPSAPAAPAAPIQDVAERQAPLVTTASYSASERPLGLRYSLAQVVNGTEKEVGAHATFHSGDMVRVKVEGNRDGYLYVIARGSSGNWKPLFPAPDINGGQNHVPAHSRYALPSSTQAFTFDEQPGEEQLFIVYSAEPIRDMDSMIPSLTQGGGQPAAAPDRASKAPPLITASAAPITDGFVSQMRQTYARDLVVQTVTPKAPETEPDDPRPEDAVYVVNKTGGRLVADIRLEHR